MAFDMNSVMCLITLQQAEKIKHLDVSLTQLRLDVRDEGSNRNLIVMLQSDLERLQRER